MPERSPVIFWLLLAATLVVYAVVASWVASEPFPAPVYAWLTFDALNMSLISIVCIWSAIRPEKTNWSRWAPVVAVLVAAFFVAAVVRNPVSYLAQFKTFFPGYGLHGALLLAGLWMLQRSSFWQRRYGARKPWRFSMAQLLTVMTVIAILSAALHDSTFLGAGGSAASVFIACTVCLALGCVALWSTSLHSLVRLASAMGIALLLGRALYWETGDRVFSRLIGIDLLIQAFVLSVWLWTGVIMPAPRPPANGEPETAT